MSIFLTLYYFVFEETGRVKKRKKFNEKTEIYNEKSLAYRRFQLVLFLKAFRTQSTTPDGKHDARSISSSGR